jgi:hypothetical protein
MVVKGHIMLGAGHIEEAEVLFRSAVMTSDTPAATFLRVIVSFYDNHYVEAAYELMQKYFAAAGKDNTDGYAYMALCCHDLNHHDEYMQYLEKACALNPQECRDALSHLFPNDIAPEKYYQYALSQTP